MAPKYTPGVCTAYYRPPELFFKETGYDERIDIWSVGCIFFEVVTGFILFYGDEATLATVFMRLFRENNHLQTLPEYASVANRTSAVAQSQPGDLFLKYLSHVLDHRIGEDGVELLSQMLHPNRTQRLTADEALAHPWFTNEPQPATSKDLVDANIAELHEHVVVKEIRKLHKQRQQHRAGNGSRSVHDKQIAI